MCLMATLPGTERGEKEKAWGPQCAHSNAAVSLRGTASAHLVQRPCLDAGCDAAHGAMVLIDALALGAPALCCSAVHFHSLLAIRLPRHQVRQLRVICQAPRVRLQGLQAWDLT